MYARFKTRKWRAMTEADRIDDYLQRLTPLARSCLLTELERLEVCGDEIPGSAALLEKLRAEFRKNEQTHKGGQAPERVANPSRYFFNPLEPLLVNGAPEHANSGWILRGSLAPIWEWISRDLLPTMARDYVNEMKPLIAADKPGGLPPRSRPRSSNISRARSARRTASIRPASNSQPTPLHARSVATLPAWCACCAYAMPWRNSAMRCRPRSKNSMTRRSPE
jgi:hypothetical protein